MNRPIAAPDAWAKVEKTTSYCLLVVLVSVISTRLAFAGVWQLPPTDFVLSLIALLLVAGSFWFARRRRWLRIGTVVFAGVTQLLPMVVREPVLLFPLLGALIPVAILVGCLVALSRKGQRSRPEQGG